MDVLPALANQEDGAQEDRNPQPALEASVLLAVQMPFREPQSEAAGQEKDGVDGRQSRSQDGGLIRTFAGPKSIVDITGNQHQEKRPLRKDKAPHADKC